MYEYTWHDMQNLSAKLIDLQIDLAFEGNTENNEIARELNVYSLFFLGLGWKWCHFSQFESNREEIICADASLLWEAMEHV